jgi:hypothetical protein
MKICRYSATLIPAFIFIVLIISAAAIACIGGIGPDTRQRDSYGWVACSTTFSPLSDALAAAYVQPVPEQRSGNNTANACIVTPAMVSTFINTAERNNKNETPVQANPYNAFVTGNFTGTTDQIIQWAAVKWGIPVDWVRAQFVQDSNWDQSAQGGSTAVASSVSYPAQSRIDSTHVYQRLGISQVLWNYPDLKTDGIGTEPVRWQSTAFAADYYGATVRFQFDNPQGKRATWGDGYVACQNWNSIGAWKQNYPWANPAQAAEVTAVQGQLASRAWAQTGFSGAVANASLTSNHTALNIGSSAVLKWTSANASSCTGTNFSTGGAANNSSGITVTPSVTTTYSIVCNGAVSSITVNVDTRTRDASGWASCTNSAVFAPLSDSGAAVLVENVQADSATRGGANATANNYVPSSSELTTMAAEKDVNNKTCSQANPYCGQVTGNYKCANTDMCIQWAAVKWGIPKDWLRAEYVNESNWYQQLPGSTSAPATCANCNGNSCGDQTTVVSSNNYPSFSRINSTSVCQSVGISQARWNHPDSNDGAIGSEPGRWKSTAFSADYQAARVRFYFDDPNGLRTAWGDSSYVRCQNWNAIGGWFNPYPWNNSGQQSYVSTIQGILTNRTWEQPGF